MISSKKEKNKTIIKKDKWWFKLMKQFMKIRYRKPKFIFLGSEITNSSLILSNHEGTDAPMSLEIYLKKPIRFWGSYQMNSGLKTLYNYQTKVYYHEKKHWNLFCARLFCLFASPITNLIYKGLNIVSTYPDARFRQTLKQSLDVIKNGENIVVFPEKSTNGYKEHLEGFHDGSVMFAEHCLRNEIDLPIFISYYNKRKNLYIIDKPIPFSEIKKNFSSRQEISKFLCDRCNELGKLSFDYDTSKKHRKQINKT